MSDDLPFPRIGRYELKGLAGEGSSALVYRACELYVAGTDVTRLASMAKLKDGRMRREVSDACLQYYGGMGFMNETPVSRAFRDGRLTSIGGGADEVMLTIICKLMGTLPGTSNAPEQKAANA